PGGGPRNDLHYEDISPFVRAFVIRNPALPHQQVDPTTKVDPSWKKLNAGRPYNLLRCRKNWTLVIKVYEGAGTLQSAGPGQGKQYPWRTGPGEQAPGDPCRVGPAGGVAGRIPAALRL